MLNELWQLGLDCPHGYTEDIQSVFKSTFKTESEPNMFEVTQYLPGFF